MFAAILLIEAVIFVFSAKKFEADRIAQIENSGIAWIQAILRVHANVMDGQAIDMASKELPRGSKILGFSLYHSNGEKIGHFGNPPSLVPAKARGEKDFVASWRSDDGNTYEAVWEQDVLGAPFSAVARLDTSSVPGEIKAFAWRIGGLVLIVSVVGTLAAIFVLGFLVFAPIITLRARLLAAGDDPGSPHAHLIKTRHRDELGDVTEAFNDMVRRLAASMARIRSNEKKLFDSNDQLERRVAQRTTELSDANKSLRRETAVREMAEQKVQTWSQFPDQNPEPVLRISADGTILYANQPSEELINSWQRRIGDTLPHPFLQVAKDVAQSGHPVDMEATATEKIYALTFQRSKNTEVNIFGRDVTSFREAKDRIQRLANLDLLTGLPNRNLFTDRLEQISREGRNEICHAAVHLVNLDNFSEINITLGLSIGDQVLQETAERLQLCANQTDTVARLGADEFALIQKKPKDGHGAATMAQKIIEALSRPFEIGGRSIHATASAGISLLPEDGISPDHLMRNAELALAQAKSEGGGVYRFFVAAMNEDIQRRKALESDMYEAVENGEFRLFYQPKIHLESGTIGGAEVLLRWEHPEHGFLSPTEFIPIAERSRQIIHIGGWVLHAACRQSMRWQKAGLPPVKLAVNLSAVQFGDESLPDLVERCLLESGLDPKYLELEITESVVMEDVETTINILDRLNALEVSLSIDDFGTGYSSLGYLRRFPINRIKIDKSFVDEIGKSKDADAVANAIITLGHALGLEITAEGVETEVQVKYLKDNGCDEIQGYYYSRPLSTEDFAMFIKNYRPWHTAPVR